MATTIGKEKDVIELLCNLIELDYDAIEAYQASIERLKDPEAKRRMREFMGDHERHTQDLSRCVRELGGQPPKRGDIKRVLTKGKVVLGSLGSDRGILMAMKTNEKDTNKAYERATSRTDVPRNVREILLRNYEDERKHLRWIEEWLARGQQAHA